MTGTSEAEVLNYYGFPLRAAALVEILRAQRDDTTVQLTRCAGLYKEEARHKLFPTCKAISSLSTEMRHRVADFTIDLLLRD